MIEQISRSYTVQHMKLRCYINIDQVRNFLVETLPHLDPELPKKLRGADIEWIAE